MKFLEIVKMIKEKKENKNVLVLVRCGAFFVSIGKDAIWLSENLGLKTTCITNKICKIGIPVGSIYDYIDRLEQLGYSFVIYHYSKEMILESANRYAEAYRYQGKCISEENLNLECEHCAYNKKINSLDNINLFEELKKRQKEKEEQKNEQK